MNQQDDYTDDELQGTESPELQAAQAANFDRISHELACALDGFL